MKYVGVALAILILMFMGAVFHESDLSRNFEKFGDARAWFFDIPMRSNKAMHANSESVVVLEGVDYEISYVAGDIVQLRRCR